MKLNCISNKALLNASAQNSMCSYSQLISVYLLIHEISASLSLTWADYLETWRKQLRSLYNTNNDLWMNESSIWKKKTRSFQHFIRIDNLCFFYLVCNVMQWVITNIFNVHDDFRVIDGIIQKQLKTLNVYLFFFL